MQPVTRFAPSPTGRLHAGHAWSALAVWHWAREREAQVLLRIEDIDHTRCRVEYDQAIRDDLRWLGLQWHGPVRRQSARGAAYAEALSRLREAGLIYPCFCTRREVRRTAAGDGFEGPIYAGACRRLDAKTAAARLRRGEPAAWRLNLDRALTQAGPVAWRDEHAGARTWDGKGWGDIVVARKDIGTSYHLAVVVDDAAQAVTCVIRGMDLFHATHLHVLLQRLLGLATPGYAHHALWRTEQGTKMSKRDGSPGLRDAAAALGGRDAFFRALIAGGAPVAFFDHIDGFSDAPADAVVRRPGED